MADLPAFQYPDLVGSYVRGRLATGDIAAQQQGLTEGGLRIDQLRLALQGTQMQQDYARQLAAGPASPGQTSPGSPVAGSQTFGAQNLGSPTGGVQTGPQAATYAPDQSLTAPSKVNTAMAIAALQGRDAFGEAQKASEYQKAQLQLQAQGPLNLIDTLFSSNQPARAVMANPSLIQQWPKLAQQLGLDPVKDFNDANVRQALVLAGNGLRATVGLPDKSYGFSGTLSPGQTAFQNGQPVASAPDQMTAYQKQELALQQRRFTLDQSTKDIPSGYERDPGDPTGIRPIAGGPHDPNAVAAGLDSRSSVMFQRVASSAQAAIKSIQNIGELPVSTSTGWFGNAQPSGSLLGSVRSVLSQKVTGQDAQDMKTMIAGVSRNLATIETAGLAPNGSLTHSMDNITIGEGDTQMTKLRKMAEMRQIVEENLGPQLSNPKLPPVQKQLVSNLIAGVQQAVPFTHHDITQLERSKNPRATIMDFAQSSGVQSHPPEIQGLLNKYK